MKNKTLLRFLVCLVLLFHFPISNILAQSSLFKNYTTKDGLPSLEVYNVMQDSKGYMWFSTERGVSRFDGYEFKTFTTNEGLADNMVFECMEDYKGRIWFRSTNKLSYYFHDSIFQLPVNDTLPKVIKNSIMISLFVDSLDNIYIGTHGKPGIIEVPMKEKHRILLPKLLNNEEYLCSTTSCKCLAGYAGRADSTYKNIMIDSMAHLYLYTISGNQLPFIKQFSWKKPAHAKPVSSIHCQGLKMRDGKIITSFCCEFLVLNNSGIEFHHLFDCSVLNLSEDRSGNIWVTLSNEAPVLYSNGKITEYPTLSFLRNKRITSVFEDTEGGLWFTSLDNGVYYLSSLNFRKLDKETGLPWNKVNTFTIAPDSTLWVSALASDKIVSLHNDSISIHTIPKAPSELSITGILFHTNKTVWLSNTEGLMVFSNSSFSKGLYFMKLGVQGELENEDGEVWANIKSRLYLYKLQNDSLVRTKDLGLNSYISSTCIDYDKTLWIGTFSGLWSYSNNVFSYYGDKNAALKDRIVDIKRTPQGNLWMATPSQGVILKNKDSFININTQNGLPSNYCTRIAVDYNGNIWIATSKGLSHIINHTDPSGICHIDTIKNISSPDLMEVSSMVCIQNIVYIGTSTGIVYFNLNKIEPNKVPPPVYITSIKINSKSTSVSSFPFKLHYDENYIAITYVGLTYREAGNTQYRYKMEGIDTGWIYTKYTSVQYPKMPPGKYSFIVSAMNNDGLWNPVPARISLIISPPFWATWWARITGIAIIIGFIYWRIRLIEKREKLKTEVNRQITDMELRVLRSQMDPHFLFNSLNTLTDLVEDKSDNAPKFVNELSKFYRYSFQHGNSQFVPLETEVKQVERYIFMLRIRFADNLKVIWKVDNRYMNHLLPIHSMQLLIENITKHNIISSDKNLWVEIMTTDSDSIIVKNQLRKKDSRSTSNSLGLNAINDHYRLLTNKKINITTTSEYFSVELPLIKPEDYDNTYSGG